MTSRRLLPLLCLLLPSFARAENITGDLMLGGNAAREGSLHAMVGLDGSGWAVSSGVTTTVASPRRGGTMVSVQPIFPASLALAGAVVGLPIKLEAAGGGALIGWLAGQILTNSEARAGLPVLSVYGAHQLDLFVPGWHPREKLSVGMEAGQLVLVRVAGFRSFSSVQSLDGYGAEVRLVLGMRSWR